MKSGQEKEGNNKNPLSYHFSETSLLSCLPSLLARPIFCQSPLRFTQCYITFLDIYFIKFFLLILAMFTLCYITFFIISFQLTFRKYPGSNGSAIRQKIRSMVRVPREVFGRKRRSSGKKSEIYSTFDLVRASSTRNRSKLGTGTRF